MTDVIDRPPAASPDPDDSPKYPTYYVAARPAAATLGRGDFQSEGVSASSAEALGYLGPLVDKARFVEAIREFMYLALNAAVEIEEIAEMRPGREQANEACDLVYTVANVAQGATALLALLAPEAAIPGASCGDLLEDLFMDGPRPLAEMGGARAQCLAELLVARRAWFTGLPYKMVERYLRSTPGYQSVSN